MPGKNVHFAPDVYFPPTPSPTYSSSSLPSSDGPLTPPQLGFTGSPYAHTPLPLVPSRIHPALGSSHTPVLKYDVSLDPSTVTSRHPSMSPSVLKEPATNPPLPSVTIRSLQLPWHIVVTPSGKPGFYVTVGDVLTAIYRALRTNVTATEFKQLQYEAQHMVNDAYKRRYARIPDVWACEQEKIKGLKRVDYLGGRTTFLGLSSTSQGPDVWQLNVS